MFHLIIIEYSLNRMTSRRGKGMVTATASVTSQTLLDRNDEEQHQLDRAPLTYNQENL